MIDMNSNERDAWSYWFGCNVDDFNAFKLHSNPMLNKSNQIILLVSKHGFNISIPSLKYKNIRNKLNHLYNASIRSIADIINPLKPDIKKVAHILYQACLNDNLILLEDNHRSIHFGVKDILKLEELKQVCPKTEWDHSCLHFESENTFGVFKKDTLVSAANYIVLPGKLASLGMLTHPEFRFHGYALNATLGAAKHALNSGLMVHFQTILENTAAIALSKKLGFGHFGYSCRLELN